MNFGPVAHLAKRTFRVPFTLVAHGIDIHPALPDATLAALRAADSIVAVSDWTRLRVLDLGGIEPGSVTTLPNTVDETRFTLGPRPKSLVDRYKIRDDEKVILTVARLAGNERYKGYDRVVQALPAIRDRSGPVRFILVGTGEDRPRVEELARRYAVDELVTFPGFVPDDELADHYRLADVFAMPSTGEGFGIVFLEAMSCGTPVVAGNRDGSVDALDSGRLGTLVDPNDIDAVSQAISAMLNHEGPDLWFNRQSLRDSVIERFGRQSFRRRVRGALDLD